MEESKNRGQLQEAYEVAISRRAKFTKNRITYVTPNGIHTVYDVDDAGIDGLIVQLKEANFECRATTQRENFTTNDWFKHGEADWWESYVITRA